MKRISYLLVISLLFFFTAVISCNDNAVNVKKKDTDSIAETPDSTVISKGMQLAGSTFKILSSELQDAIKKGGPAGGIDICSRRALNITDSVSRSNNVFIKRTSLKYRNHQNKPDSLEISALNKWVNSIEKGGEIKPFINREENGEIRFLAPIKVKSLCLKCHGSEEMISEDVKNKILKHYPEDMARGYEENDLRGAWSITFPKGYFEAK